MGALSAILALVVAAQPAAAAGPFGLAETPPMGWRSWNSMGARVTQAKMELAMGALAKKRSGGQSLASLGFATAGLDDAWQACGTGVDGSFHDEMGAPLVNTTTFPDIGAMVKKAHSLGLQAGFYVNNCICGENQWRGNGTWEQVVYEGTVKAILDWDFDGVKIESRVPRVRRARDNPHPLPAKIAGVKIDSCSEFTNMTKWAGLFAASGKPMLLENCHNSDGQDPCPEAKACPESAVCPYNLWRLGRDIGASWQSIFSNLQDVVPWNMGTPSLSRPGRWGYPDMMQVGQLASFEEDRGHFGAWCVVSSPLTLGYDLTDDSITERIWPIVSNKLAIEINHAFAGSPGKLVSEVVSPHANASLLARKCGSVGAASACCTHYDGPPNSPAHYDGTGVPPLCGTQIWIKPLSTTNGSQAVFLLNNQDSDLENVSITIDFEKTLGLKPGAAVSVYNVWEGEMTHASLTGKFSSDAFGGHDSRFYVVTPTKENLSGMEETVGSQALTCEERCASGVADGASQPKFMHCCVGLNSTGNTPSCAMGCLMGRHTATVKDCRASCLLAHGQCSFKSAATGGATLNLCASCASGAPRDCKSRFASGPWDNLNATACDKTFNRGACNISGSTCSVQLVEDWAPVRGCQLGDCYQGCSFQQGCAAGVK
jgi:alpha-galactosidase